MQRDSLDLLRRTLFPQTQAPAHRQQICSPQTIMPLTTFDPQTPGSPDSLESVGLKTSSPYQDGAEFQAIIIDLIANTVRYHGTRLDAFKTQMTKYLTHLGIDNEACLNQMEDDSWTGNSIPSQDGRSQEMLNMITAPVLTMLRKITSASVSVSQVSRYLSDEVSFSVLTQWSMAISHLANPASSARGRNAGVVQAAGSNKSSKSKDIPSFNVAPFTDSILKGDRYIQKTANTFKSKGVHNYLTDVDLCASNKEFSQAFASRLRESIVDNAELMYIATKHKDEDNCDKLWALLNKTLMSQKLTLSRECALWKDLFNLHCNKIDDFPKFYSNSVSTFHNLKELSSIAETDDNFKRVFYHKHLDVAKLKDSTKLFVTDYSSTAEDLLDGVKRDYGTFQASESIKDDKPGSILKGSVRRAYDGNSANGSSKKPTDPMKGTPTAPNFPCNVGNKIPDEIYKQVKSWYHVMAKKDKSAKDMKFLEDFKFEDRKTRAELDAAKGYKGKGGKGYNRYKEEARIRRASQYDDDYDRTDNRRYHNDRDYHDSRGARSPPRYNDRDRDHSRSSSE